MRRRDRRVIVQIRANAARGAAQRRAPCAAVSRDLARDPGVAPADIFINPVEVSAEARPLGDGPMQDEPGRREAGAAKPPRARCGDGGHDPGLTVPGAEYRSGARNGSRIAWPPPQTSP
ncbi:tautomerase family protein [Methylobacterium radiotolerans]|uniref:tautomerase family protein n=1 Tax=Methylobacterium radiotolerans TaxID=31998 RepID=UPI0009D76331|nr:tautomerase family protein [Methylobacterium radiotolerans]